MSKNVLPVDVEGWYHILDDPAVLNIERWGSLEFRVERNVNQILELLYDQGVLATFFWLG